MIHHPSKLSLDFLQPKSTIKCSFINRAEVSIQLGTYTVLSAVLLLSMDTLEKNVITCGTVL